MRKYLRSRRKPKEKKVRIFFLQIPKNDFLILHFQVKQEIDENSKEATSISCHLILCRICESTDELIDISKEANAHYLEKLHQIFPAASTDETKVNKPLRTYLLHEFTEQFIFALGFGQDICSRSK